VHAAHTSELAARNGKHRAAARRTIPNPRAEISAYAPRMITIKIKPRSGRAGTNPARYSLTPSSGFSSCAARERWSVRACERRQAARVAAEARDAKRLCDGNTAAKVRALTAANAILLRLAERTSQLS
jgi:hypothetical protein